MKRTISFILILVLIFGVLIFSVNAKETAYSWYCVHVTDHKQPKCDPTMSFIDDLGGYYIDKLHGDKCEEKVVYLTFDAGYENGNISLILDTLKAENVKGAFFVLSYLIEHDTDLVCRMINEGHTVGNHTARHRDMSTFDDMDSFYAELSRLEDILYEKTGYKISKYYRPPEGKFSKKNLEMANELGYKTIFWSFAYADWDNKHQMSEEAAKKKILSNIHNGAILLLHPTSGTNAAILGDVIRALKTDGYRFGTLNELTGK